MKLIDVDETLRLMGYEEEMYQYEENYGYRQAEKFIAKQPTVEAIPIEWLEKKAKMYDDLAEHIGGMWGEIYGDWAHLLRQLVEKWRKENDL